MDTKFKNSKLKEQFTQSLNKTKERFSSNTKLNETGGFGTKIKNALRGCYGNDDLNTALLILAAVLTGIGIIANTPVFSWIALGLLIYMNFRALSKNRVKRINENRAFRKATELPRRMFKAMTMERKDNEHAYRVCPKCHQICRIPKGRGKVDVHCPGCHSSFQANSGTVKGAKS